MRTLLTILLFTMTMSAAPVPKAERNRIIGIWANSNVAVLEFTNKGATFFSRDGISSGTWEQSEDEITMTYRSGAEHRLKITNDNLTWNVQKYERVPGVSAATIGLCIP